MPIAIGQITIADVHDGAMVEPQYASNTSETVPPSTGWGSSIPSPQIGTYIWKRERTVYGDGSFDEWGTPFRITGTKGDLGDVGPEGPQGPPGNPGRLGMYAVGTTLHLKGFADDGTLTADHGYLYVGDSRIAVPQFSKVLTGEGQGYIAFRASSNGFEVAKIIADGSSSRWEDYNDGSMIDTTGFLVIGSFVKNGTVVHSLRTFAPLDTASFERAHFMDILASNDWPDVNRWAQANGIGTVFGKIAALEAFYNKLFANEIEMSASGVVRSANYSELDGIPSEGFQLRSLGGILKAVAAILKSATISDATITGSTKIDLADSAESLFRTQYGSSGTGSYSAPAKTRWRASDACAAISAGTEGTATVDGSSSVYAKYFRATAASRFEIIHLTGATGNRSYTVEVSGQYHFRAYTPWGLGQGSDGATIRINGVAIFDGSGEGLWETTRDLAAGDVVYCEFRQNYGLGDVIFSFVEDAIVLFSGDTAELGTGSLISSMLAVRNTEAAYAMSVVLGTHFTSSAHLTLAGIDAWYHALADGQTLPCTASSTVQVGGVPYTAKYLSRASGLLTLITVEGEVFTFTAPANSTDPATRGWHDIAGTIYPAGEIRGLAVGNLIPIGSGKEVGAANNRFNYGYFQTVDAPTLRGTTVDAATVDGDTVNADVLNLAGKRGYAIRAWANTNNGSMRVGQGISSTSRRSTGVYRFNLSPAMPDTNYAVVGTARDINTNDNNVSVAFRAGDAKTTTYFDVTVSISAYYDTSELNVMVIR